MDKSPREILNGIKKEHEKNTADFLFDVDIMEDFRQAELTHQAGLDPSGPDKVVYANSTRGIN